MKRFSALFGLLVAVAALAVSATSGYHLLQKLPVPGDEGWDYATVDSAGRRLYVSHGSHVEVLDVDSGKLVGKINDTAGVHGIAIAEDLGRGFTSNGQGNSTSIFDLKTMEPITEVK